MRCPGRRRALLGLCYAGLIWPVIDYVRWHRGRSIFNP